MTRWYLPNCSQPVCPRDRLHPVYAFNAQLFGRITRTVTPTGHPITLPLAPFAPSLFPSDPRRSGAIHFAPFFCVPPLFSVLFRGGFFLVGEGGREEEGLINERDRFQRFG